MIDLVEILKDCPIGMELDSPVLIGKKTFKGFRKWHKDCPIEVQVDSDVYFLTRYGQLYDAPTCGCVIYPKGEDTWKNYLDNSFKDGDIVVTDLDNIAIVSYEISCNNYKTYCVLYRSDNKVYTTGDTVKAKRLATYDERGLLFQALVEDGYKWNPETKSVERLETDNGFVKKDKRYDEIREASVNNKLRDIQQQIIYGLGFVEGAVWSDNNPDKNSVYTKQELRDMGFSFDINGNIVTVKEIEAMTNIAKEYGFNKAIKKACDVLEDMMFTYIASSRDFLTCEYDNFEEFVEAFKKAVEE